jgi:hypothetical protein
MWSVSRGQLPGKGEDLLLLSSSLFWCLVGGSVHVDRCWWDDGEKGLEKEVGTLGVEVHRQRSVELCSWDAEGHDGNCDGRAGDLGAGCVMERSGGRLAQWAARIILWDG